MHPLRILFLASAFISLMRAVGAAEGAGFGAGAHPLSPTVVSMWLFLTNPDAKPKPMLLVYFTGAPGWHQNRKWESEITGNAVKEAQTNFRLTSDATTLEIAISDDRTAVWIQDRKYELDGSNVYVVKNADNGSSKEAVSPLGVFELVYSSELPLAVLVLRDHPEIAEKLN